MSTYGKRHYPDASRQDGTKSAESLIAQEAISSLIKKVEDLKKEGQLSFYWNQVPRKTVCLDEKKTTELGEIKGICKTFARQIVSQQKQIKKLFAITTKMRAFCIRDVPESQNQNTHWSPGRTSSFIYWGKIRDPGKMIFMFS